MERHLVRSVGDALAYLVDCELATVETAIGKKKTPKCEMDRFISIAQIGVDWMREFGVSTLGARAAEVMHNDDGSVAKWAEKYRV